MNEPGGASAYVQRGMLLKQQRRYSEAESFFRDALSQNPNDSHALFQLSTCLLYLPNREREALQCIEQAIAIEPNEALYHGTRAFILCGLRRPAEGLKAADTAIGLDPTSPYAYTARAEALMALEKWSDAEAAARQALEQDPDNAGAANLLAHALRLQNKMDENAGQIAGMLARDPEDATTHASAGWAALQRGQHRVAEQHFLEALRLDPESEFARQGLLNSFRARSPIYRGYLAYCFKMQQIGGKMRVAVVFGLLILVNFSRVIFTGPMAPLGMVAAVLYMVFVLWVWVARPVGNFILLFDRVARHALKRAEKIEAVFVGGALGVGLPLLLWSELGARQAFSPCAIALIASAFPMSMTLTNPSRAGKILFGCIGGYCLLASAVLLAAIFLALNEGIYDFLTKVFWGAVIGGIATTWLGNIPALRQREM